MAKKYVTNGDRILQAVLADEDLIRFGEYNPAEYNPQNETFRHSRTSRLFS